MSAKNPPFSSQVEVTPLVEADIDQFDPIFRAHIRDVETNEPIVSRIEAIKSYMRGAKDKYGRTRTYLVARDKSGQVVGCMAYALPDPDMVKHFQLDNPQDYIELLNAYVSPAVYRGGGVGRKLFTAICDEGRAAAKKQLLIHSAQRFQDSWGFYDKMADETTGYIHDKYVKGRHVKTWRKVLSE